MKDETLQRIRDETQRLDGLPLKVGSFDFKRSDAVDENTVEIFYYDSPKKHCTVGAYYDDATREYKIKIRIGLIDRSLTRFFDGNFEKFFERIRAELEPMLNRFDKNDFAANSFVEALNLNNWQYGNNLPPKINSFELFIAPSKPVEYTNGSFIIVNYVDFDRARDLAVYYNVYTDGFSAESHIDGHIHVLYDFDAKNLIELEDKLRAHLENQLTEKKM